MGTPYDVFDVFDFPAVYKNYKAVIFTSSVKTDNMKRAVNLCRYFNVPYKKVQLGDVMRVTVTVNTNVQGIGVIEIPITARSTRSGISEKYWK